MKDWLPIYPRNRVALGLAALSLVTFVWWNLLPSFKNSWGVEKELTMMSVWPELVDYKIYREMFRNPSPDMYLDLVIICTLFQNAFAVFLVIPFWRFVNALNSLRVTLGIMNLLGGLAALHFLAQSYANLLYQPRSFLGLVTVSMLAMAAAMMVFKNELPERFQRELQKSIGCES